jgi:hypothetical protein
MADPIDVEGRPALTRPDGFVVPTLRGRHVVLRQVMPEDYRFLRAAELTGEHGVRWRYHGATPSPEEWARGLWQSVLAQLLVVAIDEPTPIGLVAAYRPNFQDGHAALAAQRFAMHRPSPLMMLGTALFIDYVFTCWNFHKLYLEVPEYNLSQFQAGGGRVLEVEGRLRNHHWYGGRRWDQVVMAIHRDVWQQESTRMLAAERLPDEMMVRVRVPAPAGAPQ